MQYILKGQMTRRLLLILVTLSLIPTLLIVIVTSALRVQEEQSALQQREAALADKADTVFNNLIQNKVAHLEQVLLPRMNVITLLARYAADLHHYRDSQRVDMGALTGDDAYAGLVQPDPNSDINTSLQLVGEQVLAIDTAIQALVFRLPGNDPMMITRDSAAYDFLQAERVTDTGVHDWQIGWQDDVPLLVATAPIMDGSRPIGSVQLVLGLDVIADEVSRYGLADSALMFLTAEDTTILAIPSWVNADDALNIFPDGIARAAPIAELVSRDAAPIFYEQDWAGTATTGSPTLFSGRIGEHTCYFAYMAAVDLPLSVVLVLPEAEVFNTAISYGARLSVSVVTIVSQVVISGLGFLIVVMVGSIISLRQIAAPVHYLSTGANAVAAGDYTCQIPEEGIGELVELAQSFNAMIEAVRENQERYQLKQQELAEALDNHQREFAIISQVSWLNNRATDLPGKLTRVLQIVNEGLSIEASAVLRIDETGRPFPVTHSHSACEHLRQIGRAFQLEIANRALASPSDLLVEAIPDAVAAQLSDCGCQCRRAAALPIRFRKQPLGVLVTYYTEADHPIPAVQAFLPELASHIALMIENARLQSQARFLLIADERRNMARELHDSVTQTIFGVSLVAEGLLTQLGELPPDAQQALEFLIEQSLKARQELRQMINELRPFELGSEGLVEALENHVRSFKRATHVKVQLDIDEQIETLPLPIQHNLDRIVQEAISNIMRHAQASQVAISLRFNDNTLSLHIQDDGQGFDAESVQHRHPGPFGLISIRERAEIMGGHFTLNSQAAEGTSVDVTIPLDRLEPA
jgi:signal transduction histidine kinase